MGRLVPSLGRVRSGRVGLVAAAGVLVSAGGERRAVVRAQGELDVVRCAGGGSGEEVEGSALVLRGARRRPGRPTADGGREEACEEHEARGEGLDGDHVGAAATGGAGRTSGWRRVGGRDGSDQSRRAAGERVGRVSWAREPAWALQRRREGEEPAAGGTPHRTTVGRSALPAQQSRHRCVAEQGGSEGARTRTGGRRDADEQGVKGRAD